MSQPSMITLSLRLAGVLAVLSIAACATTHGTVAPPLPIALNQAQAQAYVKQAGINVTRQFVGQWEAAKANMKDGVEQCAIGAGTQQGRMRSCWDQLENEANQYAGEFSGMTVSGLTPPQMDSFNRAKSSSVAFFNLTARYAATCSRGTRACLKQGTLRMEMNSQRKAVDNYLMNARVVPSAGSGMNYEQQSVNQNLESLRNPAMVPPSANVPKVQQ